MWGLLISLAAGVGLALGGCFLCVWRHRKISLSIALLGAIGAGVVMNLIVRSDLANDRIQPPIDGAQNLIAFCTFVFSLVGLIAGACVVWYFRYRLKANPVT